MSGFGSLPGSLPRAVMLELIEAMRSGIERCERYASTPQVVGIDVAACPDATAEAAVAPAETPPRLRYREEFGKR